jgi:hypothetical protein
MASEVATAGNYCLAKRRTQRYKDGEVHLEFMVMKENKERIKKQK